MELNSANSASRFITRGLDLSGSREGAGGIGGILATKAGSTTGFYFYDGNGNVVDVIDSSDSVIAHYQYDPFGNKVTSTGSYASQPYQWSTKEFSSSTDLVYYLFRFYNPNNGRWLNRDPIQEIGGENVYASYRNYPVGIIDKFGLISESCKSVSAATPGFGAAFPVGVFGSFSWDLYFKGTTQECEMCCPDGSRGKKYSSDGQVVLDVALEIATLGFTWSVGGDTQVSWWLGAKAGIKGSGSFGGGYSYNTCEKNSKISVCGGMSVGVYAALGGGYTAVLGQPSIGWGIRLDGGADLNVSGSVNFQGCLECDVSGGGLSNCELTGRKWLEGAASVNVNVFLFEANYTFWSGRRDF